MIAVFFSALLFGLVHPGSKIILSQGLSLYWFCLLYISIRLFFVTPFVIKKGLHKVSKAKDMKLLVLIGFVGAFLQLTEFAGVYKGLPVPLVTFLVYSHPLWGIFLSNLINKEKISYDSIFKLILGLAGIYFILLSGNILKFHSDNSLYLFFPIIAGFFISMWVSLSKLVQHQNNEINTFTISFYYDLFALVTIILIGPFYSGSTQFPEVFLSDWRNILLITFFSLFIGLLPNLLFYFGVNKIKAFTASLILLLEPFVSTVTSVFIWHYKLNSRFLIGAILILGAASPLTAKMIFDRAKKIGIALVFAFIFFPTIANGSKQKKLYFYELVPMDFEGDYTTTQELNAIQLAFELAIKDAKKNNPSCGIYLSKVIGHASQEKLYESIKKIAKANQSDSAIVIGFSRSSFAKIAANAAGKSSLRGLSVGAATTDLQSINKNFWTIATPWQRQWRAIKAQMKKMKCDKTNTIAKFKFDALSSSFRGAYLKNFDKIADGIDQNSFQNPTYRCFFIAQNFSSSIEDINLLMKANRALIVFGVGDWYYHSSELESLVKKNKGMKLTIMVPTGWNPSASRNFKKLSSRMPYKNNFLISPAGAYTYDSTFLAYSALCKSESFQESLADKAIVRHLLRDYSSIAKSGNFVSKIQMVKFAGIK